jgi:hypothetical protein
LIADDRRELSPDGRPTRRKRLVMPGKPTDASLDAHAQCAVVIQFLEPPDAHSLADLHATIGDVPVARIDAAVTALIEAGVLARISHGALSASAALTRLDNLGLIAV